MAGDHAFYTQKRLFAKTWQRHAFCAAVALVAYGLGTSMQTLAYDRYNTFRGKTRLYGNDLANAGKYRNSQ